MEGARRGQLNNNPQQKTSDMVRFYKKHRTEINVLTILPEVSYI